MIRPLVVFGAGGFGREVLCLAEDMNRAAPTWDVLGFLDDDSDLHGKQCTGLPVLGGLEWLAPGGRTAHTVSATRAPPDIRATPATRANPATRATQASGATPDTREPGRADAPSGTRPESAPDVAVGVGSPAGRRRISERIREASASLATLIHPGAVLSERVELGPGVLITAGCVLTTEIRIGAGALVNLACTVGHDVQVGEYAVLSPGVRLSGKAVVEEGAELGTGAVVLPGVRVGAWSVVGAGAVVHRDVPANAVAVGVPARIIRERTPGWQLDEL